MAADRPKQIILGTAGHIDHGKTTLIKALTGVNTDRLKEEQRRGITIELGFADINLPGGQHLGIVDVPGHERFVRNMVAGATGIDMVAMIIAADEGVMPQTREHMDICTLLGIRHGLVVLTKTDMVDEEWLELAVEDVREFVRDTFLENSRIMPVSSLTGKGLPELVAALEDLSREVPQRSPSGLFRLPADRVFSMKGFGTVVTGTPVSGRISTGDTVMIYPSGIQAKIRGLQSHNRSMEQAEAGMRTAVNLQGLDRETINRGDVLALPDTLRSAYMLDVSLHYLRSNKRPLKNRTQVRFHSGTSEVSGRVILLESDEIRPGDTTVAQLRLDTPVALVRDDRFVLRSFSPVRTIGGGAILNPVPRKHKRFHPEIIKSIDSLADLSPEQLVAAHVRDSGCPGLTLADLRIMTNLPEKALEQAIAPLLSRKVLVMTDRENRSYIHGDTVEKLRGEVSGFLADYHRANPLRPGMSKEELKSKFPSFLDAKPLNMVIQQMIKSAEIVQEGDIVRLADHEIFLGADQTEIREKILTVYTEGRLTPPFFKAFCQENELDLSRARDVMQTLVDEGRIIKAKEDIYFEAGAISALRKKLTDFLDENEDLTTPQFKDMTGVSRKYLIPLIEYFDAIHVTIRVGEVRKLRKR